MPGKQNPAAHKAPRRARRMIALYGMDYQWMIRLINAELKIQRKVKERTPPNTTKYAAAVGTIIQCEQVLGRIKRGSLEWEPTE